MQELLPRLAIPEGDSALSPQALFPGARACWLEIGFGGGEHLAALAAAHADVGFIGCEPFVNGVASLLRHIEDNRIGNIRVSQGDVRLLMPRLPEGSVERVYIMFPDPWPKLRHRKRRLVSPALLDALHRLLPPGGLVRAATDDADYGAWILEHFLADDRYRWTAESAGDWKRRFDGSPQTRYEQKAREQGRGPMFMEFVRE